MFKEIQGYADTYWAVYTCDKCSGDKLYILWMLLELNSSIPDSSTEVPLSNMKGNYITLGKSVRKITAM